MKKIAWIIYLFICYSVICLASDLNFSVKEVIEAADVHRTTYKEEAILPLYQGNGCFGSSFSQLGLHVPPSQLGKATKYGKTDFMHIEHYGRGEFNADYLLPLLRIYWKDVFNSITAYNQHQSFYDGTIETSFKESGNPIKVTTWFDAINKDLACISIEQGSDVSQTVVIDPYKLMKLHYNQEVKQSVSISKEKEDWKFSLTCMGKQFAFYVNTDASGTFEDGKLYLTLKKGSNSIKISYKKANTTSLSASLKQTKDWWHRKWENTGCIKFPELNTQRMWVRSMAAFLYSYSDDKLGIAPPMGFAGNGWPFTFPQDLSYVHPALLSTGNINIAKSWVEYWGERVEGMKAYTKRLLKVKGILSPWVFPYGDFEGYHDPLPPNNCYYEIHNSGYLAKMAHEASVYVNDPKWTKNYVIPIIRETAEFYKSICQKESDGLWHIFIIPGMGQDELGGFNQKDYLCSLYSAKYCFQQAIDYGLDKDGMYAKILKEGLAFSKLKAEQGFYYSCQGRGPEDFGKQKHPVQLNELAYLPTEKSATNEALTAYKLRYDITQNAKQPFFHGWTLGEFLLAGSRVGNAGEWLKDWNNMQKSDYVDPDYIQVYETSKSYGMSFYNTTNGLIAQSLINNLVSDWYGELEVAKCFPWQEDVYFKNIYSLLGVKVCGSIVNGKVTLALQAWKDTSFKFRGEQITLKKGKEIEREFSL